MIDRTIDLSKWSKEQLCMMIFHAIMELNNRLGKMEYDEHVKMKETE